MHRRFLGGGAFKKFNLIAMHNIYLASLVFVTTLFMVLMSGSIVYADEADLIYVANCAECHGSEGYGTEEAPSLRNNEALAKFAPEMIYYFIMSGATGYKKRFPESQYPSAMPGYEKDLSAEEVKLLATMINKWNP